MFAITQKVKRSHKSVAQANCCSILTKILLNNCELR